LEALEVHSEDIHRLMRPYGAKLGNRLGCGSFGCVWEIMVWAQVSPDEGFWHPTPYALKITTDPTEGPVTQALINTGLDKELDGLCRFEAVRRVPANEDTYVIIRENVGMWRPVPWLMPQEVRDFQSFNPKMGEEWLVWSQQGELAMHQLSSYDTATQRWIRAVKDYMVAQAAPLPDDPVFADAPSGFRQVVQQFADARDNVLDEMDRFGLTRWMAEAIRECTRENIHILDLHGRNLGYRQHSWVGGQQQFDPLWKGGTLPPQREGKFPVLASPQYPLLVFDLGHSSAPDVTVESLRASVRENPAWGELAATIPDL
jgi:hypothetical protein